MNDKVVTFKIDGKTKREAQQTARALGLSLSAVIKRYLRDFIKMKTINFSEEPSEYLIQAIKSAEEDYKTGRTISFDKPQDALQYVDEIISRNERKTRNR